MEQIRVELPDQSYTVSVGEELMEPAAIASLLGQPEPASSQDCAIITNPRVGNLYAQRLADGLRQNGYVPRIVEVPEGEAFKTLNTVQSVYDALIEAQLDRRSIVFALGGGVVGDLAGFVAATYLRGVPFVQVPTTLLGMVDASIGGKAAVDHPRGKNLVGSFKQPLAVLADTGTLSTLPEAEWRSGMAEVVKHGIIGDPGLLDLIRSDNWKLELAQWIARAIRVKVDIVMRDPFERGERANLNLGHTFGHALERVSHFRLRHGDGVGIGLVCATRLSARLGECAPEFPVHVEELLQHLKLPTQFRGASTAEEILDAMQTDKKRAGTRLQFVLTRGPGDVVIRGDIDRRDVLAVLEEVLA